MSLKGSTGKRAYREANLNANTRRVLLDNSLTLSGFHYNDPREIYVEFRWRFHN